MSAARTHCRRSQPQGKLRIPGDSHYPDDPRLNQNHVVIKESDGKVFAKSASIQWSPVLTRTYSSSGPTVLSHGALLTCYASLIPIRT